MFTEEQNAFWEGFLAGTEFYMGLGQQVINQYVDTVLHASWIEGFKKAGPQ